MLAAIKHALADIFNSDEALKAKTLEKLALVEEGKAPCPKFTPGNIAVIAVCSVVGLTASIGLTRLGLTLSEKVFD